MNTASKRGVPSSAFDWRLTSRRMTLFVFLIFEILALIPLERRFPHQDGKSRTVPSPDQVYRDTIHTGLLILLRYNPRHGNTHPVGLRVFGGVALSDTLLPLLQRTGGPCRGPGATATPTHAQPQRAAEQRTAHDRRTGRALADPAPQHGGTCEPVVGWRICTTQARRRRPPRGFARAHSQGREGVAGIVVAPPLRAALGWSSAGRGAPSGNARSP